MAAKKPAGKPAARAGSRKAAAPKRTAAKTAGKPAAPEAAKARRGRKPVHPIDEVRARIERLASFGIPHAQIAGILGLSTKTLHEHYRAALELGMAKANELVGGRIFDAAVAGEPWALKLWAARRLGWKETVEHTGSLTVNRISLRAPDLPLPQEDPDEDYGLDDLDPDEFSDEDFGTA